MCECACVRKGFLRKCEAKLEDNEHANQECFKSIDLHNKFNQCDSDSNSYTNIGMNYTVFNSIYSTNNCKACVLLWRLLLIQGSWSPCTLTHTMIFCFSNQKEKRKEKKWSWAFKLGTMIRYSCNASIVISDDLVHFQIFRSNNWSIRKWKTHFQFRNT